MYSSKLYILHEQILTYILMSLEKFLISQRNYNNYLMTNKLSTAIDIFTNIYL